VFDLKKWILLYDSSFNGRKEKGFEELKISKDNIMGNILFFPQVQKVIGQKINVNPGERNVFDFIMAFQEVLDMT